MAYGLPDGLWLPLLVMAVIILALLWKDKISKSDPPPPPPDGPSVSMTTEGSDHTKGEKFKLEGSYSLGDGTLSKRKLEMNGKDIESKLTSWSGGSFRTSEITVPDTRRVKCRIEIKTQHGDAFDNVIFNPSEPGEPDGPELDVRVRTSDSDPGRDNGSVEITASPTERDAEIAITEVELPDLDRHNSVSGDDNCVLTASGLAPGTYQYEAETEDENGKTAPDHSTFSIEVRDADLSVEAGYEVVSHDDGKVILYAEVQESSLDIEGTSIKMKPVQGEEEDWIGESSDGSRTEYEHNGLPSETYEYEGKAVDVEHNEDFDRGTFEIGLGGDGPQGPGDFPEGWGAVFQNTNNNFNGIPPQFIEVLRDIIEETGGRDDSGDVTQEVGMDAYQLLLALNALEPDLSGDDNSRILSELERIREAVEDGQTTPDDLENSLRAVLHDIFGQDLQGVLGSLEVEGFDEDAIVQAIRRNQVDVDPLTARLDNIEQAVSQLQSQGGGDFSDLERKLDEIESAVRDTQIDEGLMQQFMSQLQSMESEGVDVDVDVEGGMDEAALMRLMDGIQDSGDPEVEMEQILEVVREQGRLNRELIQEIIEEEEEGHRRGVVNPVAMTKDPSESGGEGNKNEEDNDRGMANANEVEYQIAEDTKKEINELEEAFSDLQTLEEDEREELQITQHIEEDIEQLIKLLKDVRKHEHKVEQLLDNEITKGEWQKIGKHEEKIETDLDEAKAYLEDFMESVANIEDHYKENDQVLSQLDDLKNALANQQDELISLEGKLEDVMDHMGNYRENSKASQNY